MKKFLIGLGLVLAAAGGTMYFMYRKLAPLLAVLLATLFIYNIGMYTAYMSAKMSLYSNCNDKSANAVVSMLQDVPMLMFDVKSVDSCSK